MQSAASDFQHLESVPQISQLFLSSCACAYMFAGLEALVLQPKAYATFLLTAAVMSQTSVWYWLRKWASLGQCAVPFTCKQAVLDRRLYLLAFFDFRIVFPSGFPASRPFHNSVPAWASEYMAAFSKEDFKAAWVMVNSREPLKTDCSWNSGSSSGTGHLKVLSFASFSHFLTQLVTDRKWSKGF